MGAFLIFLGVQDFLIYIWAKKAFLIQFLTSLPNRLIFPFAILFGWLYNININRRVATWQRAEADLLWVVAIDAHRGGGWWGGIKVYPPSKIFARLVNKNAIKHQKVVPSPKNLKNPYIPSLPKFGKNLPDPPPGFSNRLHLLTRLLVEIILNKLGLMRQVQLITVFGVCF